MSKIVRSLKNVANGYTSTQVLVRNATSNDPTGPTTFEMEDIAAATFTSQTDFLEIMDMIDRRLNDKGKNWRHVVKSLTVLDYLVRYGLDKCVLWSKDNLYIIKTLREFVHFDDLSEDQGALIRVKAKELVALLQDDERLARERKNVHSRPSQLFSRPMLPRRRSEPYDLELQRALELSRETAEQEKTRQQRALDAEANDPDLQAALKLSLEEEELRKVRNQRDDNLLDLTDHAQPQLQFQPQYVAQYQQPYLQQVPGVDLAYIYQMQAQQAAVQPEYDMFGNLVQPAGVFANHGQFGLPQMQQYQQPNIPQYTGFVNGPAVNAVPAEELKPLKTGSNNPFALQTANSVLASQQPQKQLLNTLVPSQANARLQFYTQPSEQPQITQPQGPQKSRFNDSHELNNILATGPDIDTYGNTGATRIPHQYTARGSFVPSGGVDGINNAELKVSSNATGNPFLNTGIAAAAPKAPHMNAAPTGYGFGNSKDEPSLIDI